MGGGENESPQAVAARLGRNLQNTYSVMERDGVAVIPVTGPLFRYANLFTMMEIVSTKDTFDFFNEKYNNCEIRYGDMKKQLAEDINKFCAPIRERILDMAANTEYLDKVARMGAEKARESASKTLNEVRQIIGFRPY